MSRFIAIAVAIIGLTAASTASAGDDESPEIVFAKHQVETFGDDTVDGNLAKPDGVVVTGIRRRLAESMIRIRKDFRYELVRSLRH